MAQDQYFVRFRGRVTGPYGVSELKKLARRGSISPIHEVSLDRVNWMDATELENVFIPTASSPIEDVQAESNDYGGSTGQAMRTAVPLPEPGIPVSSSDGPQYYYGQGGQAFGPISLAKLRDLALSLRLRPDDSVRLADGSGWLAARDMPELASCFSRDAGSIFNVEPDDRSVARREGWSHFASLRFEKFSTFVGISAAAVFLVSLHIPCGRVDGRLLWWWSLFGKSSGTAVLMCGYLLWAGLGLPFVALLLGGKTRAWAYIAVAGLGIVVSLIFLLVHVQLGRATVLSEAFVVLAVVAMPCAINLRANAANETFVKMALRLIGVLVITATIISIFADVLMFTSGSSQSNSTSAWLVISLIVGTCLVNLCRVACGVFALFAARTASSRQIRTAAMGFVIASLTLQVVVDLFLGLHVSGTIIDPFLVVNLLRVLVVAGVIVLIYGTGLRRIIADHAYFSYAQDPVDNVEYL